MPCLQAAAALAVFLAAAVGPPRVDGAVLRQRDPFGTGEAYAPSAFCGVPVVQFQSAVPPNERDKGESGQGNFGYAMPVKPGAPLPLVAANARGLVGARPGAPPAQPAWLRLFLGAHATATAKTMTARGDEIHGPTAGHQMAELLFGTLLCSPLQPCPHEMPVMTTLGAVPYAGDKFYDVIETAQMHDNENDPEDAPYAPFASVLLGSVLPQQAAPAIDLREILFPAKSSRARKTARAAWAAYENKVTWLPAGRDNGEDATDAESALAAARSLDAFLVATQQMLLGLQHLEAHGNRHRDMKPDNALLDGAVGSFVLTDFGTMCACAAAAAASLPAHLAPLISGCKADIVTLGCQPFPAGTPDFASPATDLLYSTNWYQREPPAAPPPGAALILGEALAKELAKVADARKDVFTDINGIF